MSIDILFCLQPLTQIQFTSSCALQRKLTSLILNNHWQCIPQVELT